MSLLATNYSLESWLNFMEKKINSRLYARRGTTAEWLAEDALPLGNGELGYDIEKKDFKMGDGNSKWENLEPFVIDSKLADKVDRHTAITLWQPDTDYKVGDKILVKYDWSYSGYDSYLYAECITAHTSSSDFLYDYDTKGYWQNIVFQEAYFSDYAAEASNADYAIYAESYTIYDESTDTTEEYLISEEINSLKSDKADKSSTVQLYQEGTEYGDTDITVMEYNTTEYGEPIIGFGLGGAPDGTVFVDYADFANYATNADSYLDVETDEYYNIASKFNEKADKTSTAIYEEVGAEEETEATIADIAIADSDGNVISTTYVKQSLFKEDKINETITLEANTQINCGERTILNILLPSIINNGDFFDFVFSVSSNEITMTMPSEIKFSGSECEEDVFTPSLNKTYHVIISKVGDELWGEVDSRNYIIVEE